MSIVEPFELEAVGNGAGKLEKLISDCQATPLIETAADFWAALTAAYHYDLARKHVVRAMVRSGGLEDIGEE